MTQAEVPRSMHERHPIDVSSISAMFGAGLGQLVAGFAAIVLPILGLAGIFPDLLLGISALAVGGALMFEGGAVASRFQQLLEYSDSGIDLSEIGGGMSAEFLGGSAGTVLGLLALLQVHPVILTPVAAIIFGGTLVVGSGVTAELRLMGMSNSEGHEQARQVVQSAVSAASGIRVLGGLAAIVLGILGLVLGAGAVLALVAFLGLGGALLLSGTAIGGKMVGVFRH